MKNNYKKYKIKDIFEVINGLWIGKTSDLVECKVIRNTNFKNNGGMNLKDVAILNVDKKALSTRELICGDIILEKSGGSDVQPDGRVILFDLEEKFYSFSNFTSCLRVKDKNIFYSRYCFYFLFNFWLNKNTENIQRRTTGIRNLDMNLYLDVNINLPSLEEQKKIADILTSVDENILKTNEAVNESEKLKNGLMEELFSRGIDHKKFKETKIGRIPEDWEFKKMSDICTVRQGLQIPITQRFKEPGENRYKYITIKNLKDNNFEYIESPKQSVICKEDDILMTRTGNTGTVVCGVDGVFHNNFFMVDYNRNSISKDYLIYYLNRRPIQKTILDKAGLTTIPDLNHGDFYSIFFLMPKLEEQKKIAEILMKIDNKINNYKEIKNNLINLKNGLMNEFFK